MPLEKVKNTLTGTLEKLSAENRLKGPETVITGVIPPEGGNGTRYRIAGEGGREFLRMNSNSYLGLSLNREVSAAGEEAVHLYGSGPGAVRFISGTCQIHRDLEKALAGFHGREECIIFSSAYSAVMGTLPALVSEETLVVTDALNHNSIINAIRLGSPGGKEIFPHGDMAALEEILEKSSGEFQDVVVVTDGIFSMRGDHAQLGAIRRLINEHDRNFPGGIVSVMDDSHGVGAFGTTGRGTEEYTGAKCDILIATLGKALGVNGGYLVSDAPVVQYLRETSPFYIYTNPLTPSEAAAALKALKILDSEKGHLLLGHLRNLIHILQEGIKDLGLDIIESEHPVVPLLIRDTGMTKKTVKKLFKRGILATPIVYPVVPRGEEEIRLQVTADMTEEDIAFFLAELKKIV